MIDHAFDCTPYNHDLEMCATWSDPNAEEFKRAAKKYYFEKQNGKCCYCHRSARSAHGLENDLEHIVSRDEESEFTFTAKNLAIVCKQCNGKKLNKKVLNRASKKYPTTKAGFKIYHPHFDSYESHILIAGGLIYSALSNEGAFTIQACHLWELNKKAINDNNLVDYYNPIVNEVENLLESESDREKKQAVKALVGVVLAASNAIHR